MDDYFAEASGEKKDNTLLFLEVHVYGCVF